MTRAEALAFRKKIESAAILLPDEQALESIKLFPGWEPIAYTVGDRCRYNDKLYKCYNAITGDNPTWTPDVTAAHWEVVAKPEEEGTLNNPIAAEVGMRYYKDKYYKERDKIYKCTRDDNSGQGTILYYTPSQLVGQYFEEVTA